MKRTSAQKQNSPAFALVIALITIVLVTVMAVGYLATSGLERSTARAVANRTTAEMAARSAVNAAIARLVNNLTLYPDSATSWEVVNVSKGGALQYEGTVLYFHPLPPEKSFNVKQTGPPPRDSGLHALPLISGSTEIIIPVPPNANKREANLRIALPVLDETNSYDLNHVRFAGDTQGWIGAPVGSPRPVLRAQWINLPDPSKVVTARYAYWMEDESFKANVNLMGVTGRGGNTLGNLPNQIPLQGLLQTVLASPNPTPDYNQVANDISTLRGIFPNSLFLDYRQLNQVVNQPTLADSAKFSATLFSSALNLSRSGTKRVNLNKVVITSTTAAAIRSQLDQIISTIKHHLPNFGQRFYRLGNPAGNNIDLDALDVPESKAKGPYQTIYLNKIAANIRDYIDSDSQPTIVNNDGDPFANPTPKPYTVRIGAAPTRAILAKGGVVPPGDNEVIAIGKENVPLLQEYMLRVKQIAFSPRTGSLANYTIEIDHYLEFWNMTNQDIALANLGPNPFLRIANQFGWDVGTGLPGIPAGVSRDFSIPLSAFSNAAGNSLLSFPAGSTTVLTTDPVPLPATFPNVDTARVFRPPAGTPPDNVRVYSGTTTKKSGSELRLNSIPRPVNSSTASDFQTELILGNDNGLLEGFGSPGVYYITVNVDLKTPVENRFDTTLWYYRASSLKGNSPSYTPIVSQLGDPRTNNEQLSLDSGSTVNDDQTGYKLELYTSAVPGSTTFTRLNSIYVDPSLWTDPSVNTADAAHAPTIISNAPLTTIAELGQVFDPVRLKADKKDGSGDIAYSRGGGRTFKIGQPELYDSTNNPGGLWDGDSTSASREWTAWRLTDIFSTVDETDPLRPLQLDGRINVNGVNRDGGIALKAALYGYLFQSSPASDPLIAGRSLDAAAVDSFIAQLEARVTNNDHDFGGTFTNTYGPIAERDEVSEMPIFNQSPSKPNNTYSLVDGVNTAQVYDRGREELFRRLAELITVRGSTFTVYAVGQSIGHKASGEAVATGTSQIKVTFRLDPVWAAGVPADPFIPTSDPATDPRFAIPTNYAVQILYAGP